MPFENDNCSCPCWGGDGNVYFISDRSGSSNVWCWAPATATLSQLTAHTEEDVKWLSFTLGASCLAYCQAGRLHLLPLEGGGEALPLSFKLPSDLRHSRPGFRSGGVLSASISPTGVRAALNVRGEVLTVPVEHGSVRNVSNSPGVNERSPAWSPNGHFIATLTYNGKDEDSALIIRPQIASAESGEPRTISLGPHFFYSCVWSPDSRRLALVDKEMSIWIADLDAKYGGVEELHKIVSFTSDPSMGKSTETPCWSPDSQWLAYLQEGPEDGSNGGSACYRVMLYSIETQAIVQATDGRADVASVCWSTDGKCLFYAASSYSFGPEMYGLDMSTLERPVLRSIYSTVLSKGERLPFPPRSDDEAPAPDEEGGDKDKSKDAGDGGVKVTIDADGLCDRTAVVPLGREGYFSNLAATDGQIFFIENDPADPIPELGAEAAVVGALQYFDMAERAVKPYLERVGGYEISANGEKLLALRPGAVTVTSAKAPPSPADLGKGSLPTGDLRVAVEPAEEWAQMLAETHKLYRDLFYASNMHGVDWDAQYAKYAAYLPHCAHRVDLTGLQCDMLGELSAG